MTVGVGATTTRIFRFFFDIQITSLVGSDNIIQADMLIPEPGIRLLHRQMDRLLGTVMQAGIADLTTVSKYHLVFRYRDIIRGTYPGTGTAMYAVIIDCIIKRHVLIDDLRRMRVEPV